MPNTFTQLLIHLVFAVKGRNCVIQEIDREKIEKYICGIAKNNGHKPLAIYCMPDHLHFLIGLNPKHSISDTVREIKQSSNYFINENKLTNQKFYWQEGFGAFSYSKSSLPIIVNYILNQRGHHLKISFKEEYVDFLKKYGIDYKNEYLFEFYQ